MYRAINIFKQLGRRMKKITEIKNRNAAMARKSQMRMVYPSVKDMVSSINMVM